MAYALLLLAVRPRTKDKDAEQTLQTVRYKSVQDIAIFHQQMQQLDAVLPAKVRSHVIPAEENIPTVGQVMVH